MCGNQRGDIAVPTAEQNRRTTIVILREPETAILRRHFNAEGADRRQAGEILRRNFSRAIVLIWINLLAQIGFELLQKRIANLSIFRALGRERINAAEIVSPDKKIAGETATIIERIARCFGELECF